MKRLIQATCIFFCLATGMSERGYSDSVDMLYTNYSIQHIMNEVYNLYEYPTGTPADTSYGGPYIGTFSNFTSTYLSNDTGLPLSAGTSSTHGWESANSSIGLFNVQNSANAYPMMLLYYLPEGIASVRGDAITNVSASWGFRPDGTTLIVDLLFSQTGNSYGQGVGGGLLAATLWDTTDSTMLISLNATCLFPNYDYVYSNNYTFSVDPSHIYEFYVSATTDYIWDKDYVDQNVTASITSIPEPSTMLLLGCGLLCLVRLTKRFAK